MKRAIRELLGRIEAADALDDLQRAIGWTVICRDLEYDRITLYGIYDNPIDASRYASRLQAALNEDVSADEQGWRCEVWAILPDDGQT